jgi:hypothetical protein
MTVVAWPPSTAASSLAMSGSGGEAGAGAELGMGEDLRDGSREDKELLITLTKFSVYRYLVYIYYRYIFIKSYRIPRTGTKEMIKIQPGSLLISLTVRHNLNLKILKPEIK